MHATAMRASATATTATATTVVWAMLVVRAVQSELVAIPGHATRYEIIRPAPTGAPVVQRRDSVTVHATGYIKQTNAKFWSTNGEGRSPFTYQAGVHKVITGWDEGCLGMAIGEVRKASGGHGHARGGRRVFCGDSPPWWTFFSLLFCGPPCSAVLPHCQLDIPPGEGYGGRGFPAWKIPEHAELLFEIEGSSRGLPHIHYCSECTNCMPPLPPVSQRAHPVLSIHGKEL